MFDDDKSINPLCKLIYYEVAGYYTKPGGKCHTTDEQFAELFEADLRTIQRAIKKLEDEGYIVRETFYKGSKTGRSRTIYLTTKYPKLRAPDNTIGTTRQYGGRAPDNMAEYKNIYKNNKSQENFDKTIEEFINSPGNEQELIKPKIYSAT
jgi:DNA-binding MarR family transcriptional regulator